MQTANPIMTTRLKLVPCELRHFEAILGEQSHLVELLDVTLAEGWLGFDAAQEAMLPAYEYLREHPTALGWWTYLFVHRKDGALIGLGGFKGPPGENGVVEIGYAIAPGYEGEGLATEAAKRMIDFAFSDSRVARVDAHTLPERNGSVRVLEHVGMQKKGVVHDPDDGEIWHWSLSRNE